MQLAQSSVGKTLLRPIIAPPMLGSRSAMATWKPCSARSKAVSKPAMPAPITSASNTRAGVPCPISPSRWSHVAPSPCRVASRACISAISLRKGLVHTVQMALSLNRSGSIPRSLRPILTRSRRATSSRTRPDTGTRGHTT